ncbi:Crp/Fnr family transcriptional regulator [Listeria sp. ILCC797]|uniref:Crp/Fnr family transcriptional regulator n=1 Tax=Listeria sp. ILCC797 TaxID=1918333 RepID=UPI000B5945AA|nr:Crp/Fnr family transcriptional regulator [Listeria sp. ILCC797]
MMYNRENQATQISEDEILTLCKREKDFNKHAKMILFKKGQTIFTESNPDGKVYFLVAGTMMLNLSFEEMEQQELTLKFLTESAFFAPDALMQFDSTTQVNIKSLTSGACWEINHSLLTRILARAGIDSRFFLNQKERLLQMAMEHLVKNTLSKEERIRACIAQIGLELGREDEQGQIILPSEITQPILAKYSTATREFVALTLGRLVQDDILHVRPKPWIIKDINRL